MEKLRQRDQISRVSVTVQCRSSGRVQSRLVATAVVFIHLVAIPFPLSETAIRAQVKETEKGGVRQTQGGTLNFGPEAELTPDGSTYLQTIGLANYVGQPLKAVQLRVISSGGLRLRSVERGADTRSSSEWNLSHVIVHGKTGIDTAKVVIFGLGATSMPARPYSELLTVTYDVLSSSGTATLSLSDVLGALKRGENANVVVGSPRIVSLNKGKRK